MILLVVKDCQVMMVEGGQDKSGEARPKLRGERKKQVEGSCAASISGLPRWAQVLCPWEDCLGDGITPLCFSLPCGKITNEFIHLLHKYLCKSFACKLSVTVLVLGTQQGP